MGDLSPSPSLLSEELVALSLGKLPLYGSDI